MVATFMHPLNTYNDALTLARSAACVDYFRDTDTLSVFHDDHAQDIRTVYRVKLDEPIYYLSKLTGFDPKRNAWTKSIVSGQRFEMINRRGLKTLRTWLREHAITQTGFPNPAILSLNPKPQPQPITKGTP